MRLIETGFIENWKRMHWPKDTCQWKGKSLQAEPISLDGVSGSFILLGLVAAGGALCYEFIEHRCCPSFGLQSFVQQLAYLLWIESCGSE